MHFYAIHCVMQCCVFLFHWPVVLFYDVFLPSHTISQQEASSLRSAHTKALEMLMNYQEENDKLRVTVSYCVV